MERGGNCFFGQIGIAEGRSSLRWHSGTNRRAHLGANAVSGFRDTDDLFGELRQVYATLADLSKVFGFVAE